MKNDYILSFQDIENILTPQNIENIKKGQLKAKNISDNLKKSLIVDLKILREPYTI